jgi:hypothetical protein
MIAGLNVPGCLELFVSGLDGKGPFGTSLALEHLMAVLTRGSRPRAPDPSGIISRESLQDRQDQQLHELDRQTSSF